MLSGLRVVAAHRIVVDVRSYVEVTLTNLSDVAVGPGGLRLVAHRAQGSTVAISATNHWPLGRDASVYLTAMLPAERLKHVDVVDYVAFDGTVHPLGDRLTLGWLSSKLKRGTIGADVQA